MKHRNWFTLVIRLLGILFVGLGMTKLISSLFPIYFLQEAMGTSLPPSQIIRWALVLIGSMAQFGFGLYLLFGGKRLINWCLLSAERMPDCTVCIHCGYDLSQTPGATCPECGKDRPQAGEGEKPSTKLDSGSS